MYKPLLAILLILVILSPLHKGYAQKPVSIGTNTPDSSAIFEIASSNKGLLPPRLSFNERNLISSPATGLIIWCTNCNVKGEMQVFDGMKWKKISSGNASVPQTPVPPPFFTPN